MNDGWRGWLQVRAGEGWVTALSFLYFGMLLAAYYTLRPVRDALAADVIGATDVRFAFLGVFLVMVILTPVFGALASVLPRRRLIPVVYLFFIANILVFQQLFSLFAGERWLAFAFFMWLSVFNLFVVSVFWSFMADIFNEGQAQRLFGPIAAGGSVGALIGPTLTAGLVESLGLAGLMVVSASLLGGALGCMLWLSRHAPRGSVEDAPAMGGSALEGLALAFRQPFLRGVTGFMILGTLTGSLLYLQQVELVGRLEGGTERLTAVFARVDLGVNLLSITFQLFLTSRILDRLGFARTLALLPVVVIAGFALLALFPLLAIAIATQILRRSVLFAVTNPVSQMLYTAVGPRSRYKFKNFLDTAVYRAGDTTGSWLFAGIAALGLGLPAASALGAAIALVWSRLALRVGRQYDRIVAGEEPPP